MCDGLKSRGLMSQPFRVPVAGFRGRLVPLDGRGMSDGSSTITVLVSVHLHLGISSVRLFYLEEDRDFC